MRRSLVSFTCASLLAVAGCVVTGERVDARQGQATPAAAPVQPTPTLPASTANNLGYYRFPAIRGSTIVFVAEGDLWRVGIEGGVATRLTTHPGEETSPAISPDGSTLAFIASYEGPREVYTMPLLGGLPTRVTYDGVGRSAFVAWAGNTTLLHSTGDGTTIPRTRLALFDTGTRARTMIPLDQAADGAMLGDDKSIVFTRLPFQGSHTDRYQGGTAQQLWRFTLPALGQRSDEAVPLTRDYPGTSKRPMFWNGRIYFTSDRDGRMNVWSMNPDGKDLRQHTRHDQFDIGSTALDTGRIVYQLGPDLWLLDIASGQTRRVEISIDSDMDQTREKWVKKPSQYLSAAHVSATGDKVVLTARGRVFVFPVKQGRTIEIDRREGIRYRDARFMPDGKSLVALSDESGEVELVTLPGNGVGAPQRLTNDAEILRFRTLPSPDGKLIAHADRHQRLWVYDAEKKSSTLVEQNPIDLIERFSWSGDSRWLAYVAPAGNMYRQIKIWNAESSQAIVATSDRYDSDEPQFSPDGKWLYFLSDRTFKSVVPNPWGPRAPEPFLDKPTKIYALALKPGERWPFQPDDELFSAEKDAKPKPEKKPDDAKSEPEKRGNAEAPVEPKGDEKGEPGEKKNGEKKDTKNEPAKVEIVSEGLSERLFVVPVPNGNYSGLMVTDKALFYVSSASGDGDGEEGAGNTLSALPITNEKPEVKAVVSGLRSVELSGDRKKLLLRKGDAFYVIDAAPSKAELDKAGVDLSGWSLSVSPREEWRQMYVEAWRLLRDYFYDQKMHGVDWKGVLAKYTPWVERVRSREELSDILAEVTGELSALHHFVVRGDLRKGDDAISVGTLGADLVRDQGAGGYVVGKVLRADPDEPDIRSPLDQPTSIVKEGEVIESVNGVPVLSVPDIAVLLRQQAGRQVLLHAKGAGGAPGRDLIVRPLDPGQDAELRYRSWEVARRRLVEQWSDGQIGYVHLRAMGGGDFSQFARDYYPVFNRKGLIIDVRDNRGGNIDSWILSRLMRKAWMYWSQHTGRQPSWNMQYAFRGHMAALCNENTASDGEAFSEGFKRLGLGKVIGTRTWGGEIWLSMDNTLVDNGVASAGESGVFSPDGVWLVEGRGVEPDHVVDNLPHATYLGDDAQLKAAVDHLLKLIKDKPVEIPPVPPTPDKSFKGR